jgi:hypothetical protein
VRLATLLRTLRDRGWEPGRAAGWDEALACRWYARLIAARTQSDSLPLACACVELLAAHKPDTVRGNMYLVVSNGMLPDTTKQSYNRVQRLLNRLRIAGAIPFEWVVDNVRQTIKPSSWSGLDDFADTVRQAYRKNFWPNLPEYVEVFVEKDTVAGKVAVVTQECDVPLQPIRGYNSTSFAWDVARKWRQIHKPITVYYVGDHDPSGRDLERDVREKTARFSGKRVNWVRLAVNPEHFAEYNIRPLAPKKGDKRTRKFVEKWGPDCAEVEAVPATDLRAMIRGAIERHIPAADWERLRAVEAVERRQWNDYMAAINLGAGPADRPHE